MLKGQFVAVSTGMNLAGHISKISRSYIEQADVVYCLMPHSLGEVWIHTLNSNVKSLQPFYAKGKHRMQSYEEMIDAMLQDVRMGKKVCGAFYGHAGVFAYVPRMAVKQAVKEGFRAHMEPGVSAEACLYADLAIDPGESGIQGYEASQFLFYNQELNNSAYAIMWQIGLVGEYTAKQFETKKEWVEIFVSHLKKWYPLSHNVILYEAAVLPIETFRAETVALKDLPDAELNPKTTLVIPPSRSLQANQDVLDMFGISEQQIAAR
ncbi:MAG: hypothetical protein HWD86_05360 [Kangiellaceae bacterium]|nr:hypothetical protein [Kangiellaceae bacterium]